MYAMFFDKQGWVRRVGKTGYCSCCSNMYEAKQYNEPNDPEIEFAKIKNRNRITVCNLKEYMHP